MCDLEQIHSEPLRNMAVRLYRFLESGQGRQAAQASTLPWLGGQCWDGCHASGTGVCSGSDTRGLCEDSR